MIWLTIIPFALSMSILLTDWAWKGLERMSKFEDSPRSCEHPWFIDGRCMVCGTPK